MRPGAPEDTATREGRRTSAAETRKHAREQQILTATRALFDQRGLRDAQIDDIAGAVGINRAIIYRHFTSKEELFALTLEGYLDELSAALAAADPHEAPAPERLRALTEAFVDYGLAFPAFVDCAQTVMRNTRRELFEELSEAGIYRLGAGVARCLGHLVRVLEAGKDEGVFSIADPDLLANTLYATGLGAMQLARVGMIVRESDPGVPTVAPLSPDQVKGYLVSASVTMARAGTSVPPSTGER